VTSHSSLLSTPLPQYTSLTALAKRPTKAASTIWGTTLRMMVSRMWKISWKKASGPARISRAAQEGH